MRTARDKVPDVRCQINSRSTERHGWEMDIWPVIRAERKALAADLNSLDDDRWATPSLCTQWTVRDVLAHMTATAKMSPPSFFVKLAGSGFSLTKVQAKDI